MFYIHVGLPKTGTTFLQNEVFPKWKDVNYLGQKPGEEFPFMFPLYTNDYDTYLISKEALTNPSRFKTYEEKEQIIKNLSSMFGNSKVMISFRTHSKLITSLYKESIHVGGTHPNLESFFDIENNKGIIQKESFIYRQYLDLIETYFDQKPFVFLQEELTDNLDNLLNDMEHFIGGKAPKLNEIKFEMGNKGIGYYQAILLRNINKIFPSKPNQNACLPYNIYTKILRLKLRFFCQNKLSFISSKPIKMDEKQKRLTDEYYKDDWNYVLDYIINECPYRYNLDASKYRY